MFDPPRSKTNLFVHKDRSCFGSISELCGNLGESEYRLAPDGIYLPLNIFMTWRDGQRPKQELSWSHELLQEMYRPGAEHSVRLAKSHLLNRDD